MQTLFISDLHLEDSRPQITEILVSFLRGAKRSADALYILGDLFEFWIGDDFLTETARLVAEELSALRKVGIPCYFQHGNRDFLLGEQYASLAGMAFLPETHVIDLHGTPTLLLHGDTLCTDDAGYQAFRQQVRRPSFRDQFLGMPVQQRLDMARNARDASRQHTSTTPVEIMDVNLDAVSMAFSVHGVERMIHGHTHRPAFHDHQLAHGRLGQRLVLADWYTTGSYLRADRSGFERLPLG